MAQTGHDATGWVKRFTHERRPGPTCGCWRRGWSSPGDPIVVEHRPDHDVTVAMVFRALTTERELTAQVLGAQALAESVRTILGGPGPARLSGGIDATAPRTCPDLSIAFGDSGYPPVNE